VLVSRSVVLITGATSGVGRLTAEELAAREGLALEVVDVDVLDEGSVQAAVDGVVRRAGRIDVLGPVRTMRAALPHMRAQGSGLVVQISSLIGRYVMPFMALYGATKHAVEALAEGIRYELAPFGVESVIVEPFSMPTAGSLGRMDRGSDRARAAEHGELDARQDARCSSRATGG